MANGEPSRDDHTPTHIDGYVIEEDDEEDALHNSAVPIPSGIDTPDKGTDG
jgi:hypothetical protein